MSIEEALSLSREAKASRRRPQQSVEVGFQPSLTGSLTTSIASSLTEQQHGQRRARPRASGNFQRPTSPLASAFVGRRPTLPHVDLHVPAPLNYSKIHEALRQGQRGGAPVVGVRDVGDDETAESTLETHGFSAADIKKVRWVPFGVTEVST